MQTVALFGGLADLGLSVALALVVPTLSAILFAKMTRDIDEMGEIRGNNIAVGILFASVILSSALIIREVIYPVISALETTLLGEVTASSVAFFILLAVSFMGATVLAAVGAVYLSVRIFFKIGKGLKGMESLRANNVAAAITLAAVVLTTSLFLAHGLQSILSSLVPYPAIESIRTLQR